MADGKYETDPDWFKARCDDRRISQSQLARLMGMDKSSLSLLLHGKRRMTIDYAADIARLLGVGVLDVMERAGARLDGAMPSAGGTVPVTGWIDASGRARALNARDAVGWRVSLPGVPAGSEACQCRTAGSGAEAVDGWLVVTAPAAAVSPEALHGKAFIIETQDKRRLLRGVRPGYAPGRHTLLGVLLSSERPNGART